MSFANPPRGFWPVLENRSFRSLWSAQWLSQTAQNTINFVLIVLIERLTGSSVQQGLMILAFTLPGVIFAPLSGVIIDRWPKRHVLVASNALRVLLVLGYLLLLEVMNDSNEGWVLLAIYLVAFLMSTVAQFFNPAEAATIPMLVERSHLLAANSLFNLTLALSQVIGLIIFGPLAVKLFGIPTAFVLGAIAYSAAAWLVYRLPLDAPAREGIHAEQGWQRVRRDVLAGAGFVLNHRPVLVSIIHLTLIASLVMVLAMLAPGISSRVFHLAPEDAIVVFAPAGASMLLAAVMLGRWGERIRKRTWVQMGLAAMSLSYMLFGVIAWRFEATNQPLVFNATVIRLPAASAALIITTALLSLLLGLSMSGVNIVSQTRLQQQTPEALRGRVFSVQFMLNNLVGIPPMLAIGGMADWIGIPPMLVGIGVAVLLVLLWTVRLERGPDQAFGPLPGYLPILLPAATEMPPPEDKAEAPAEAIPGEELPHATH